MLEEGTESAPPPVSLGRAFREAFRAYQEEIVLFFLVNLLWMLALVTFALVRFIEPLLLVAAPVLVLPTAVLMRLAVVAARERAPTWSIARAELGRYATRKLILAAVQLLVLALGITNVMLSGALAGLPGILSALVAGYAVVATSVYAVALWPIVCDPEREGPLTDQLRLALALVLLRPLQIGVLALLTALAVIASVQLVVPAIFLPSIVLLVVARYVVPALDRVRPVAG